MSCKNILSLEIYDSNLFEALPTSPDLQKYDTGHDIAEIGNDDYALQIWINAMHGPAEIECNFGRKINWNDSHDEYEFDYLDSFDITEHLNGATPTEVLIMFFLFFLNQYERE